MEKKRRTPPSDYKDESVEEVVNELRVAKGMGRAGEETERDASSSFDIDVGKNGVEAKLVDENEGDGGTKE